MRKHIHFDGYLSCIECFVITIKILHIFIHIYYIHIHVFLEVKLLFKKIHAFHIIVDITKLSSNEVLITRLLPRGNGNVYVPSHPGQHDLQPKF